MRIVADAATNSATSADFHGGLVTVRYGLSATSSHRPDTMLTTTLGSLQLRRNSAIVKSMLRWSVCAAKESATTMTSSLTTGLPSVKSVTGMLKCSRWCARLAD